MDKKKLQLPFQQWIEKYEGYSDEALLSELSSLPVLPDESDPSWDNRQTRENLAYPYLALARIAGERRIKKAISLLFEKSSYGDPYEMVQGIRHSIEKIVNPDWDTLNEICIQITQSPYRGARLWAVRELGILRNKDSFDTLVNALNDDDLIQYQACMSLEMLCQNNPEYLDAVEQVFIRYLSEKHSDFNSSSAQKFLSKIRKMKTLNQDKIE
jgi:hypothetical protein